MPLCYILKYLAQFPQYLSGLKVKCSRFFVIKPHVLIWPFMLSVFVYEVFYVLNWEYKLTWHMKQN